MVKNLQIQDYIYNSFVIITLGSFGIAEVGKIFGKKNRRRQLVASYICLT